MRTRRLLPILLLLAAHARAQEAPAPAPQAEAKDAWFATRMLSPGDMVGATDVEAKPLEQQSFNLFSIDRSPVGLEVKHRILSGRPLHERDVGRHALVRANTPVRLLWQAGAIRMELQGRALQDGAAGDPVRAVNPGTARTLQGVVLPDGTIQVGGGQ